MKQFKSVRNSLKKEDFNSFVPELYDSLQAYISQTAEEDISLLGLNSLVESALNKAEAHKAIRSRIKAKLEENSSSKAAVLQYLYNFILCNDGVKTITI